MEIVMFGVVVLSIIVALAMTLVAWRVSRRERAQSAARVAALAAASSEPQEVIRAERVAVGESRPAPWAAARVSAFSPPSRPPTQMVDETSFSPADVPLRPAVFADGFLGSATSTPSSNGQRRLAVVALILFAAALVGGYWTVFGDRQSVGTIAASPSDAAPLELVSLRHERRGARLAVTGLVRNPTTGSPVDKLTAVVFLFDQQGGFITSARAGVDFLKLTPGDESPFVIDVEAPATVARYRVSFRNDAGLVPHVDRRGQEPIAVRQVSR